MRKIAIRNQIGEWIYYVTSLTFKEVTENVRREWKSEMGLDEADVDDRLQRNLTDNVEKIARYIQNQRDMFFNSLVLAVYGGNPQWEEIIIKEGKEEVSLIDNVGFLSFSENDRIFPVDGQHRVEGIRLVLDKTKGNKESNDNFYNEQTVPVILIAHQNSPEGKKRTRRLFTTLNRYAKPVNLTDIILLDEDDIVAIATRKILDSVELLKDNRVLLTQGTSISERDRKSFTNIKFLYDCNIELLKMFLNYHELYIDIEGRRTRVKGNKNGVEHFIKFRRKDEEIINFTIFLENFWNAFARMDFISDYLSEKPSNLFYKFDGDENTIDFEEQYDELFLRGTITEEEAKSIYLATDDGMCPAPCPPLPFNFGGNLLFRPIGQLAAVKAAIRLYEYYKTWDAVFTSWHWIDFSLGYNLWTDIAYNPKSGMIMSNNKLIEDLIVYITAPVLFNKNAFSKLINKYIAATRKTKRDDRKNIEGLSPEKLAEIRKEEAEKIREAAIEEINKYTVEYNKNLW